MNYETTEMPALEDQPVELEIPTQGAIPADDDHAYDRWADDGGRNLD